MYATEIDYDTGQREVSHNHCSSSISLDVVRGLQAPCIIIALFSLLEQAIIPNDDQIDEHIEKVQRCHSLQDLIFIEIFRDYRWLPVKSGQSQFLKNIEEEKRNEANRKQERKAKSHGEAYQQNDLNKSITEMKLIFRASMHLEIFRNRPHFGASDLHLFGSKAHEKLDRRREGVGHSHSLYERRSILIVPK